ncbi:toxin-antitoxin system YwqK family antitoxin [Chitinophaga sp. Cy-1792]|uniref:toxin-antitoxin system YwqK family antitoxin n=1 Tax=Chitinophaga sp. Cy-1792 TaxID=2608339 RepID=UPI00141F5D83|nr:hypothetical protein [Chitinophaga sp. Cy-1792]NIG54318.1 hypothetical protein [Chitinophaga sp. Cy-1792]
MRRLLFVCTLLCLATGAFAQQLVYKVPKHNQKDEKGRKQGLWMEEVGEIRGEPGFTWEGVYKNDRKEGKWTKSTHGGILLAEETYKNNALNGYCKYFYPDGKRSAEGMIVSSEIPGQKDTIFVVDLDTGAEKPMEIVREGNPVRQGLWKVYDEDSGKMTKQYYSLGEEISAAEAGDNDSIPAAVTPKAPVSHLPHEDAVNGKKKH